MPYIYLILIALAFSYPEVGYEAGLKYDPTIHALSSEGSFALPEILSKIAACESGDKHFGPDGKVLVGKYNRYDIGRYQINRFYWEDKAKELGYDIDSEFGNEAMAFYLYSKYGTQPWARSKFCWSRG